MNLVVAKDIYLGIRFFVRQVVPLLWYMDGFSETSIGIRLKLPMKLENIVFSGNTNGKLFSNNPNSRQIVLNRYDVIMITSWMLTWPRH